MALLLTYSHVSLLSDTLERNFHELQQDFKNFSEHYSASRLSAPSSTISRANFPLLPHPCSSNYASFFTNRSLSFTNSIQRPIYNLTQRLAFFDQSRNVSGWSGEMTFDLLQIVDEMQASLHIRGSVGEVGVHYGKSFLWIESVRRQSELAFAIDVFSKQEQNSPGRKKSGGSGATVARFWRSVDPVVTPQAKQGIIVMEVSSTELIDSCEFLSRKLFPVRLFSIDGDHGFNTTYNDMILAGRHLSVGGCMFIDVSTFSLVSVVINVF